MLQERQAEFTQRARNRNASVRIGGAHQVFAPIYGAPFVRDLKQGRRYGDLDSFTKLVKLVQMLPKLASFWFGNRVSLAMCPSASGIWTWSMRICDTPTNRIWALLPNKAGPKTVWIWRRLCMDARRWITQLRDPGQCEHEFAPFGG